MYIFVMKDKGIGLDRQLEEVIIYKSLNKKLPWFQGGCPRCHGSNKVEIMGNKTTIFKTDMLKKRSPKNERFSSKNPPDIRILTSKKSGVFSALYNLQSQG